VVIISGLPSSIKAASKRLSAVASPRMFVTKLSKNPSSSSTARHA
jgi:hypothetical protein